MKRLSLLAFTMLLSFTCIHAQYMLHDVYQVGSNYHTNADHAIIRTDEIAYFEDNQQGFFAFINSLGATYNEVKLPVGWSVWDFRVKDGIAYFCGKNRNTQKALLGYFDISNLVSGSGPIAFHYDINIGNTFTVLTRLAVASKRASTVSLMAIGDTLTKSDPIMDGATMVLYFDDYSSSTGLLYDNSGLVFWDVVATNNNFAVASSPKPSTSQTNLILHTLPIGTSLTNFSTYFNNQYLYTCPNGFVSGFRAIALHQDSIALASYYRDTQVQSCGLQVFTLSTINGQMDYHQNYHLPYSIAPTPITPPKEMAFLSDSCFIMVTDTLLNPTTVTIIRLNAYPTYIPFTTYYMAPQFEPNYSVHYTSVSALSPTTNYGFAASGAVWTSFNMTSFVYPFLDIPNFDCHTAYMVDMSRCTPFNPVQIYGGNKYPYKKEMKEKVGGIDSPQTTPQCSTRTLKQ